MRLGSNLTFLVIKGKLNLRVIKGFHKFCITQSKDSTANIQKKILGNDLNFGDFLGLR